jgi:hypothetical protein
MVIWFGLFKSPLTPKGGRKINNQQFNNQEYATTRY